MRAWEFLVLVALELVSSSGSQVFSRLLTTGTAGKRLQTRPADRSRERKNQFRGARPQTIGIFSPFYCAICIQV